MATRTKFLMMAAVYASLCVCGAAENHREADRVSQRDGQHDFDFDIGTWNLHASRLERPLSGDHTWVELNGSVVVRKVWNGKANLAEVEADGPADHLEFLALRLYNPESHQWNINFANSREGTLGVPLTGEFRNGRGEFYDQEPYNGRPILVRFVISPVTANSARSEQAFSDDGGKTWEVNWINTYTRASEKPAGAASPERQHDFDFQSGNWKTHISRLLHPLTGSTKWVNLSGDVSIQEVWNSRAKLEEIEADGPAGHFEALTLFLYNPKARQWSLNFANSSEGAFETPSIGEFRNGRGEFYDQEPFNGRAILVRVVWSDFTPESHRFEQSFSDDGGKTWEPNFKAQLTRVDGRMTQAERAYLLAELKTSESAMLQSINSLTEAQWSFKSAPDVWSVKECAEHLILAEDLLFAESQKMLATPAVPRLTGATAEGDRTIVAEMEDRSKKSKAPQPIVPTGRFATPEMAVQEFKSRRDRTIAYVETTEDALRTHSGPGPAGPDADVYQVLLLMAAHSARHTAQIREVESNPGYPKS